MKTGHLKQYSINFQKGLGLILCLLSLSIVIPQSAWAMRVKTGSYVGDGLDNRNITGFGFQPDLVMITSAPQKSVFRSDTLGGDATLTFDDIDTSPQPNRIKALQSDGFQVGTDPLVNALSTTYYYIGFQKVAGEFTTGSYTGNGASNQSITGVGFQPDFVFIRSGMTAKDTIGRSSTIPSGDTSFKLNSATVGGTFIPVLETDGFQVGSSSHVNAFNVVYHWVAWKATPNNFSVGSYTGNAVDSRDISGVGFQPQAVLVANSTSGIHRPVLRTNLMTGDESYHLDASGLLTDKIQALQGNGFQVGSAITNGVNNSGVTYHWMAWQDSTGAASPDITQSAFRLFNNTDSPDVGAPLALQDTAVTLSTTGAIFRLRMLLHVATANLGASGQSFKLQFVGKGTGTCAAPSGGTPAVYTDVTAATALAYYNNTTPLDGATLTANASDPTHGIDTLVDQTYEEANNFTNPTAIAIGQDGKWDFALFNNGALASTTFCFRIVKADNSLLTTYTVYPELTTASVSLVKQVWLPNGTSPLALTNGFPTDTTVPTGTTVIFLIYAKNSATSAMNDIRIQDLLDISATGFRYVVSSLVRTNALSPPADTASDLAIFDATAPGTGTALTDAADADQASFVSPNVTAGAATNDVLSIPANTTFAIRFQAVKQ